MLIIYKMKIASSGQTEMPQREGHERIIKTPKTIVSSTLRAPALTDNLKEIITM